MALEIRGLAPLVQVFDMPTSVRFYRDLLGFNLSTSQAEDRFSWALLRLDGIEFMLNTAYEDDERPSVPDPARVTGHADTALFFGCPDVDGV
jgi:glyoxylase I family protein